MRISDWSSDVCSSDLALQDARNEARRQVAYVERVAQPSLPDDALEPRRTRGILATLIIGIVAWGIMSMLLAGVREHRNRAGERCVGKECGSMCRSRVSPYHQKKKLNQ